MDKNQNNRPVPKKRIWKVLKQLLALEKGASDSEDNCNYWNINAEKSPYPPAKYSDISGLPAKYVDPNTKLYFATVEEYAIIQTLPNDIVTGYLALRKADNVIF